MPNVTLTVTKANGTEQAFTVNTENKKFINSIITVGEDNKITEADKRTLINTMAIGGDAGILDYSDLSPEHKAKVAEMTSKYGDDFKIEVIEESGKKFYKFTVKESWSKEMLGFFGFRNKISASTIKSLLNLKEGQYRYDDGWGHSYSCSALKYYNMGDGAMNKYSGDDFKFKSGQTFKIPVEDVTFDF